jgi:broad specificity phosphatase PhoE
MGHGKIFLHCLLLFTLKSSTIAFVPTILLVVSHASFFHKSTAICGTCNQSRRQGTECRLFDEEQNQVTTCDDGLSRRSAIGQIISSASVPLLTQAEPSPSFAISNAIEESATTNNGNLQCLLDLPPIKTDCVRLFLCRHGQTENNRLRLVQGARVDPPLNDTGRRQAIRLGESLSTLKQSGASNFPTIAMHSKLQRARETATIVSLTVGNGELRDDDNNLSYVNNALASDSGSESPTIRIRDFKNTMDLRTLSSLGEVDFGSVEGKSVNEARAEMMTTYSQWGFGRIDASNGDDGETGRSVLTRVSSAMNSIADIAASNGRSIAVVSHSTYLRMLLSLVLEVPLLEAAATFDQKNCCINVLDVSLTEKMHILPKSKVFGGKLSAAPNDFTLAIPRTSVVRMNEIRHLEGLL